MVVIKSTCLKDIWQNLRQYYPFASSGVQFLDLAFIKWLLDEHHECLYQQIAPFFNDNLLTAGCGITHHGVAVTEDEEITPIVENTIVITWLQLIHPGMPGLVEKKYGSELRNKTLTSLKPEISQALSSLLDDLCSMEHTKVQRMSAYQHHKSNSQR